MVLTSVLLRVFLWHAAWSVLLLLLLRTTDQPHPGQEFDLSICISTLWCPPVWNAKQQYVDSMSLLCTSGPSGVKVRSNCKSYGFCAFSPQVPLITFHPHLVIIGNHLFMLVWSSGWSQHQQRAVLQRCWTGRWWTQHAHWWVVNKCNRQSTHCWSWFLLLILMLTSVFYRQR